MSGSVVLCEKPSQRRNIIDAVGDRFGEVVAARGHLLELVEPAEMRPEWKSWSTELLHPGEPYPTSPVRAKQAVLGRIRTALRGAGRVIVATDMGREGHLIGMEILEYLEFGGEVMRANFNREDPSSIREAFDRLEDAGQFAGLLAAAKARQQADQICNLTLTRAATVLLTRPGSGALGLGRVRTPTLAIVCRREQEITDFVPETRWVVLAEVAVAVGGGSFTALCRQMPGTKDPITDKAAAVAISEAVSGWQGAISSRTRAGRRGPPAPHDLAALQADAGRQLKWTARKTLETAQALYSDLKLITYPRVDARVWPEVMAAEVGLLRMAVCRLLRTDLDPGEVVVRAGKTRDCQFSDQRLEGHEHHAIAPNARTVAEFPGLWVRCTDDQRKLAAIIFRRFAAVTSPDWRFDTLTLSFEADTQAGRAAFSASGKSTTDPGWTAWERPPPEKPKDGADEASPAGLPPIADGQAGRCTGASTDARQTRPPARYAEGSIIVAMKEAWRYLPDGVERERLKEAGGIGTSATRDQVIETLVRQGQIAREKGRFRPTEAGLALWKILSRRAPGIVDPGMTAAWEAEFDRLQGGDGAGWMALVDRLAAEAGRAVEGIAGEDRQALTGLDRGAATPGKGAKGKGGGGGSGKASDKQLAFIRKLEKERGSRVDDEKLAAMTGGEASAEIERLLAMKRPGGEGQARNQAPSPARLKYAEDLAGKHGVELPEECRTDWRAAKAFIEEWRVK